jgi:hypothetical protein
LEVAFELADADKNGTVDCAEFVKLYQLVVNGEVKGLAACNYKQRNAFRKRTKAAVADGKGAHSHSGVGGSGDGGGGGSGDAHGGDDDDNDDTVSQLTDDMDISTMKGGSFDNHEMMQDPDEEW